ncbi:hypothetical protein GCM10010451_27170 [Streptomyces virens]|uniref:Uncharacterized protein n=1 Tax=Streptomyces virens TaxID=285572 RepID=A0ABP6PF22_9ACTN
MTGSGDPGGGTSERAGALGTREGRRGGVRAPGAQGAGNGGTGDRSRHSERRDGEAGERLQVPGKRRRGE